METKRNSRHSPGQNKMKTSWEGYGFTFGQQTARQERNTTTKQPSSTTTIMKRKRHRQISDRDKEKRAKHRNNDTPGQHNETVAREQANLPEPKVHQQNRKRKTKATIDTERNIETDTRTLNRNNKKLHDGTTDIPVKKKSNNKRRRYQQISDSSDSSDTEEDRDKGNKRKASDVAQDKAGEDRDKSKEEKVSDIDQDEEGEPRKGIG